MRPMRSQNRGLGRLVGITVLLVVVGSGASCGSGGSPPPTSSASQPLLPGASGPVPSTTTSGPSVSPSSTSPEPGATPSTIPSEASATSSTLTPDPTYLADLKAVAGYTTSQGPVKVNAHDYLKSITSYVAGGAESIEYDLNKQWNSFLVVVGLPDDAPANAKITFQVYLDGQLRDTETDVTLGHPKAVRVATRDALRLKLVATQTSGDWATAVWADAQLTNDPNVRLTP